MPASSELAAAMHTTDLAICALEDAGDDYVAGRLREAYDALEVARHVAERLEAGATYLPRPSSRPSLGRHRP